MSGARDWLQSVVLVVTAVTISASVVAEEAAIAEPSPTRLQKLDFSKPPTLPEVDAPSAETIEQSIRKGVDFLVADQNPNGSWGSATKTKDLNIYAPVPGAHHAFRTATTSLCISSLIECAASDNDAAQSAIDKGEAWLFKYLPRLRRADGTAIYNVWGHLYSIEALVHLHKRHAGDAQKIAQIRTLIEQQYDLLRRYESVDGGWGYYDFRYQAKPVRSALSAELHWLRCTKQNR